MPEKSRTFMQGRKRALRAVTLTLVTVIAASLVLSTLSMGSL